MSGLRSVFGRLWNCGLRRRRIQRRDTRSSGSPGPPAPPAPVNAAPTAANDNYSASRDNALAVAAPGVLANDSDAEKDALTVRLDRNAAHGTLTLNPDGSLLPLRGMTKTATARAA